MKCKLLLKCNFCFSRLVTTFSLIMYNFLSGQGIVTEIIRDQRGDIDRFEYYGTASTKLKLSRLETFHSNGHVSTLESLSGGLKDGLYKEFYNNGNIKIDGWYINGV